MKCLKHYELILSVFIYVINVFFHLFVGSFITHIYKAIYFPSHNCASLPIIISVERKSAADFITHGMAFNCQVIWNNIRILSHNAHETANSCSGLCMSFSPFSNPQLIQLGNIATVQFNSSV